jgi:hypothetical protein
MRKAIKKAESRGRQGRFARKMKKRIERCTDARNKKRKIAREKQ